MQVQVDNLWASPSTLHMRVTVWGPDNKWRQRFDEAVPFADIPDEVLTLIIGHWMDAQPEENHQDTALF